MEDNLTNLSNYPHIQSGNQNILYNYYVQITIYTLCIIIVFFGVFGNTLVIVVFFRTTSLRTPTNVFLVGLAVNDIIVCVLSPLTPLYITLDGWDFGVAMCHLFPLTQQANIYVTTWTLVALAGEQFVAVCLPRLPKLTKKRAAALFAIIWIVSSLICVPYAVFMRYSRYNMIDGRGPRCEPKWPDNIQQIFTTIEQFTLILIPLALIVVCYVAVWLKLRSVAPEEDVVGIRDGRQSLCPSRYNPILKTRRAVKMLVVMSTVYGCCWLPMNLIAFFDEYFSQLFTGAVNLVFIFIVTHLIAMSSACYNPLIYATMNVDFRRRFKAALSCNLTDQGSSIYRREASFSSRPTDHADSRRNHELTYTPNIAARFTKPNRFRMVPSP